MVEEGIIRYDKPENALSWRNYYGWFIWINKAWRPAILVAQANASFLFEYEMPSGNIYLHQVDVDCNRCFSFIGQTVNRNRLPVKWQIAEWLVDMDLVVTV
jgi:hypothetical protein